MKKVLTQERVKELLRYNAETGEFIWIVKRQGIKVGGIAGCLDTHNGYIRTQIDGTMYLTHRVVWLYSYGEFPEKDIDHIDGNRSNNRTENLREVSRSVNAQNRALSSRNTSGVMGVVLENKKRKNGDISKYWVATWRDKSGKKMSKSFSVAKLGNKGAKSTAVDFRRSKILELNTQGSGYTHRHGK